MVLLCILCALAVAAVAQCDKQGAVMLEQEAGTEVSAAFLWRVGCEYGFLLLQCVAFQVAADDRGCVASRGSFFCEREVYPVRVPGVQRDIQQSALADFCDWRDALDRGG